MEKVKQSVLAQSINWTGIFLILVIGGLLTVGEPDVLDGVSNLLVSLAENLGK